MKISRRKFVARSSGLLFSLQPFIYSSKASILPESNSPARILVLIHLAGGNDWFNTIIPYQSADYYKSRPRLAIASEAVLPLNNSLALHPSMSGIKTLYDQDKVSILLDVGHAQTTLSHHTAIELLQGNWQECYAELVNKQRASNLIFPAINVEPFLPSENQMVVSSLSPDNGFAINLDVHYRLEGGRLHRPLRNEITTIRRGGCNPPVYFPNQSENSAFAKGLNLISDMIKKNTNAPIYNISLGGFDTHRNQLDRHALLLHILSEAIFSFQQALDKHGLADRVLIVVQSEFGRSLQENDEAGTDHGFTNHALVIGNGAISNNEGFPDFITDRLLYRLG